MRRFTALAAVAAILTAGGTAIAKEKAAETGAVKEKKICKGEASSTSRIAKKRVCKTKAEWAQTPGDGSVDDGERKLRGMSRD